MRSLSGAGSGQILGAVERGISSVTGDLILVKERQERISVEVSKIGAVIDDLLERDARPYAAQTRSRR